MLSVVHMKAIIVLLGVGEDLSNPRRYPLRRILDYHLKPKPLRLVLAKPPGAMQMVDEGFVVEGTVHA